MHPCSYNVKPREISAAQAQLASDLAALAADPGALAAAAGNTGEPGTLRSVLLLTLASVGRGG